MSFFSFLGNYAGRSASEWARCAGEWAAQGGHSSNVRECCYNAAKAALGNNASWDAIKKYAENLIRSLIG